MRIVLKMSAKKTATLTLRIEPKLKDSLRVAAERERRSIANMVGLLIRDYCASNSINVTDSDDLSLKKVKEGE